MRVAVDRNTGAYETFRRWKVLPDDAPEWSRAQMLSVEEAQDRGKADAKVEDVHRGAAAESSSSAASARRPRSR